MWSKHDPETLMCFADYGKYLYRPTRFSTQPRRVRYQVQEAIVVRRMHFAESSDVVFGEAHRPLLAQWQSTPR